MPHQGEVFAVAYSPDGKAVLTGGSDKTARLWDATTGQPIGAPMQHRGAVLAVAFSPNGKTVLTASNDGTARLWDAATGGPIGPPLRHHDRFVTRVAFSPDGKTVLTAGSDNTARLWDVAELPDEPERVSAWVSTVTGLGLDHNDEIKLLDSTAQRENRERLESLGDSPAPEPRWSLDPILFGSEPAARARAWLERGRGDLALAAFNEALRARPLYAPLWAERARFHAAQGRMEQAAEDAAQAALMCWNDPDLAALARGDADFRAAVLSEILHELPIKWFKQRAEVWRGRGRRRASRGDWAGALRDFAASATPVRLTLGPNLMAHACLLHLAGDDEGAGRLAEDVRSLPEPAPRTDKDGSPIPDPDVQMRLWVRLLDDPPPDPADLVHRAEKYVTNNKGAAWYVLGWALLRAGRLDEAIGRFEESLAVQRDWPCSEMNAYGLALAHHRLGHTEEARRWLERAESWLDRLDRTYTVEAPRDLSGQPEVSVPFEHWVYAQVLRREAAGPIQDASFPADPFAH
jgi:tetratricopeptide (TPR) repeat protein